MYYIQLRSLVLILCLISHQLYPVAGNDSSGKKERIVSFIKNGEKIFPCYYCGREFTWSPSRCSHERAVHEKNFKCKCNECGCGFINTAQLHKHQSVHMQERPYKCWCGKTFKRSDQLSLHQNRIHNSHSQYKCNVKGCNRVFVNQNNLHWHMHNYHAYQENTNTVNHKTDSKYIICSVCNKEYVHRSELEQHMHVHSAERPFSCNYCGKSCKRPDTLRDHQQTHKKYPQYVCHVFGCNKAFWNRAKKKRHIDTQHTHHNNTHNSNNPNSSEEIDNFGVLCKKCGELYLCQSNLNIHMQYCSGSIQVSGIDILNNVDIDSDDNDMPTYIPWERNLSLKHYLIDGYGRQNAFPYNESNSIQSWSNNTGKSTTL